MYDIIFISHDNPNADKNFSLLKKRFPMAKRVQSTAGIYQAYISAVKKTMTKMFWVVWDDLIILDNFNFDFNISKWDQDYVHVFKNGHYYDGVCLFPKHKNISQKEIEYRFFLNKKEIDIQASTPVPIDIISSHPKLFDIVFISYFEPYADQNYKELVNKVQRLVHRVDGVKGIHNAHIKAATLASTEMFWVVDADAYILDEFNFNYQIPYYEKNIVHVWQSKNPVNDLIYGYGGVKLLPRILTMNMKLDSVDMTTSISNRFRSINEISNITKFNINPFESWRSAFRECVKLSSKTISGQIDEETEHRLKTWCTVGHDKPYGEYAIAGALAGNEYGLKYKDNLEMLSKINDWQWLEDEFKKY